MSWHRFCSCCTQAATTHQVATVVTSDQVLSPPSVECKIGFPEMWIGTLEFVLLGRGGRQPFNYTDIITKQFGQQWWSPMK